MMRFVYLFILFAGLGFVGALPIAIIALFVALLNGGTALFSIYLIAALILASWLPLKALIDSRVKQQPLDMLLPQNVNGLGLLFAGLAFLFLVPVLYFLNFLPFLLGILVYSLSNGSILPALIVALIFQIISLYRMALAEKATGVVNNVFVRFNEINISDATVMDVDAVQRQEPRPYIPETLNLPEITLSHHADEEVIYFDDEDENSDRQEAP